MIYIKKRRLSMPYICLLKGAKTKKMRYNIKMRQTKLTKKQPRLPQSGGNVNYPNFKKA